MSSASGSPSADFSIIPKELAFAIIGKMNGPALLNMYQTCSLISEVVERQLEDLDPRNISLGKSQVLHLTASVVTVKFSPTVNLNRRVSSPKLKRVFFESSTKLPIDTLDSNIWRFISFEEIRLEDNDTAAKYLDKVAFEIPGVRRFKAVNCDISHVVKAIQLFKPNSIKIESFTGNLKEILPILPIKAWVANGEGLVKFPEGHTFEGVLPDLKDCQYFLEIPDLMEENNRNFYMKFAEKKMFILSILKRSICFAKS